MNDELVSGQIPMHSPSRTRLRQVILLRATVAGLVLFAAGLSHAHAQGHSPAAAAAMMTVADGIEVRLVASEPLVRQPVCIEFDDRGRLWVIQYLQYPNPEGLRRVEVDRYSRTEYDRIPAPPPHGPRGADRITILTDTNDDGQMDDGTDFVDGLNLASGLAFGHGGVFVLNVPYLLFYPDEDRDDVPDTDPKVLLTGFGMQDAHSVANSLTWGPDGWLYGCQGSTVTSKIRGHEFQQGVWRYHVETDRFELFCEGGGNAWGLDFDQRGNLFYSTNYGGYVLVHGVQGGYFVKSFAKHGDLHNAHAYGYFDHAPHSGFQGGHVTVGGIIYQGGSLPEFCNGKYVAGDLLGHGVYWHDVTRRGSTFATAHGAELLQANDAWFAPTDVTAGPDGAVYVSDWHDQRTAHPDPDADWDRTNGRIYRVAAHGTSPAEPVDYATLSTGEVLTRHQHANQWHVRRARQELVRRKDEDAESVLRNSLLSSTTEDAALQALWSLSSIGRFDEATAMTLLDSPHAAVRYWTLRLLGDERVVSTSMAHRLDEFAEREPDVWVRQQLACTARRMSAEHAVPMINANINRDIDNDDPFLPLLWWWAVEQHSVTGRDEVMRRFIRPTAWKSRLGREFLLPRLIRRYAAEDTAAGLDCVVTLLRSAPGDSDRDACWPHVLAGLQETRRPNNAQQPVDITEHPVAALAVERYRQRTTDAALHRLAILLGNAQAVDDALLTATSADAATNRRVEMLEILGVASGPHLAEPLLNIVESDADEPVRLAALRTLAKLDPEALATRLIHVHQRSMSAALRSEIRNVLLGRRSSALIWLSAVDRGDIDPAVTPLEQIRRIALLNDAELNVLVVKHWGHLAASSPEEKLAEVRRLNNDLRAGPGNAVAGKALFTKHCAVCHQLFGEGKKVGPDLTTANRSDSQALLISLVDPSSVIRKEYVSIIVQTTDGRVLTGLPVARSESAITLADTMGNTTTVVKSDIEEITESPVSLMPENLYRQLSPQDIRDLFAWLQSNGPAE